MDTFDVIEKVDEVMDSIVTSDSLTDEDKETYLFLAKYAIGLTDQAK